MLILVMDELALLPRAVIPKLAQIVDAFLAEKWVRCDGIDSINPNRIQARRHRRDPVRKLLAQPGDLHSVSPSWEERESWRHALQHGQETLEDVIEGIEDAAPLLGQEGQAKAAESDTYRHPIPAVLPVPVAKELGQTSAARRSVRPDALPWLSHATYQPSIFLAVPHGPHGAFLRSFPASQPQQFMFGLACEFARQEISFSQASDVGRDRE